MKNPSIKNLIATNKMLVESLKEANQTNDIYMNFILIERSKVNELQIELNNLKNELLCKKK